MLDLGVQPQTVAKPPVPQPDIQSTDQPSRLRELLPGGLVIVVALMTLVVFFLSREQASLLTTADSDYAAAMGELDAGPLAKTAKTAGQVATALRLLKTDDKQQTHWSALFKDFQSTTIGDVTLLTFSVDERNNLKIEGHAKTYQAVALFLANLRASAFAQKADLVSATLNENAKDGNTVNFVVAVSLKPGQLKQPIAPPAVSMGGQQ